MITNTEAIRFTNEVVRPKAEQLRALKAEIDSIMTTWHGGVSALFPVDAAEIVADGRETEGVSRVSGNDVVGLIIQLGTIQTQLGAVGVGNVIAKPCVRPLAAS